VCVCVCVCVFVFGATAPPPRWAMTSSFTRLLDHTQRRTTVGRTSLGEWSARRRGFYPTTHTKPSQQPNIYAPGGIGTHNISRRAAIDLRLRPLGRWNRHMCVCVCVCAYIYIYIYTHTRIYTHTHIKIHTHAHTHTHTHTHTYIEAFVWGSQRVSSKRWYLFQKVIRRLKPKVFISTTTVVNVESRTYTPCFTHQYLDEDFMNYWEMWPWKEIFNYLCLIVKWERKPTRCNS